MSDRPLPKEVYLDTSIVIAAMFGGTTHSIGSAQFCRRLIVERRWVYFSRILRLELTEAIRKLATIPHRVPDELRQQFQLDQWEQSQFVRRRWMQHGIQRFETFRTSFADLYELGFSDSIWLNSVTIMANERLRSHDAIHVATAREYRVPCIATTDDHFLRINDLDIRLIRDSTSPQT